MRSMATTASEVVVEPVSRELSRTRMTSPPMLLGRKLLKKVATRYEAERWREGRRRSPAPRSSRRQRQVERARMAA